MDYVSQFSIAQRQVSETDVRAKILRLKFDRSVKSVLSSHGLAPFKKALTHER